jgi:hypothetical protein
MTAKPRSGSMHCEPAELNEREFGPGPANLIGSAHLGVPPQ